MLVKSFLLHTDSSLKDQVVSSLNQFKNCDIVPSENSDVLIVAMENECSETEKKQISQIEGMPGVQMLTMVFGASE